MLISEKEAWEAGNGHRVLPDICVCCGAPVPEGRQICWQCEHQDFEDGQGCQEKRWAERGC